MIKLIACLGPNGELGKDNDLVYHNKQDMKFFRENTKDNIIVMGRNTFLSLGSKMLPHRINVVLTEEKFNIDGLVQFSDKSLRQVLSYLESINYENKTIYIIGGAFVYLQAIEQRLADELLLTLMDEEVEADTFVDTKAIEKNYEPIEIISDVFEDGNKVGRIVKFKRKE